MSFMDELRKLTQPYDDEDDFFEGADENFRPRQPTTEAPRVSTQQAEFENSFAASGQTETQAAKKTRQPQQGKGFFQQRQQQTQPRSAAPAQEGQEGLFGNLGKSKAQTPRRSMNFGGKEAQVILFSPKTFDEAGEIVNHLRNSRSVVMTLEGLPLDTARRLLDFISGIAFALQGKITPVSAKTYFVTPQNVDIIGAQSEQPESDGQFY